MEILQHLIIIRLQIQDISFHQQIQIHIVSILATVPLFTILLIVHIRLTFLQLIHQQVHAPMVLTAQLDQSVLHKANAHQEIVVQMLFTITMVMVQIAQLNMQVNLKK